MKGVILYKINNSQIIKEAINLVVEYHIPTIVLCNISSADTIPGISYAIQQSSEKGFNLLFYSHISELFEKLINQNDSVATLSCSFGSKSIEEVDWLILGYLDYLDIERFKIKVFRIGNNLGEIAALTKYFVEIYEKRR